MRFSIFLSSAAKAEVRALPRSVQAEIVGAIERILSHLPDQESKSRIKRLRGYSRPAWRLRVGGYRVFYSIETDVVEIVGVVSKEAANPWLAEHGKT